MGILETKVTLEESRYHPDMRGLHHYLRVVHTRNPQEDCIPVLGPILCDDGHWAWLRSERFAEVCKLASPSLPGKKLVRQSHAFQCFK